jgi:hypothetical protein
MVDTDKNPSDLHQPELPQQQKVIVTSAKGKRPSIYYIFLTFLSDCLLLEWHMYIAYLLHSFTPMLENWWKILKLQSETKLVKG